VIVIALLMLLGGSGEDCALEACPPHVLIELYREERAAAHDWELAAAEHELIADELRAQIESLERELEAATSLKLTTAAPLVPEPSFPASCVWAVGVACGVCGGAGAGVTTAIIGR